MSTLKDELIERYLATGKIGFVKPKSLEEAYSIIDTVVGIYNEDIEETEVVTVNLKELTEQMKNFFNKF